MDNKDNIKNELKNLAPTLYKIGNKHPGDIPAGYFDKMHAQLMHKIRQEELLSPTIKSVADKQLSLFEKLIKWIKPAYSMPALAVLLIVVIAIPITNLEPQSLGVITLAQISSEEINAYLTDNITIDEVINEEAESIEGIETEVSDNELDSYLIDHADELILNDWL